MVPPHIRVLFEESVGIVPESVGIVPESVGIVPEPVGTAIEDSHVEHDVPLEPILSQ